MEPQNTEIDGDALKDEIFDLIIGRVQMRAAMKQAAAVIQQLSPPPSPPDQEAEAINLADR